ncbi:lipopolysaccharide biosynthesis protein [Kitasatospora sp. NPDC051914]|uniref:lipopolysaccharide biosynthesis protein n=1 Tax=Kitasatospora sp. NPDC051914 TaxID=3154945 RepID=UPI00344947DC
MSDPRRSLGAAVRRWWPVVLAVPLGAGAGAGYAAVAPAAYTANSYVVVVAQNPGEGATAVNFAQAYGRLAGQPQVLAAAAARTGRTVSALEETVRGTTSPDAPMIEITGTGPLPGDAVQAADAVATSLIAFANTSSQDTGVKLVPLARAASPDGPSSPSAALDTAVGAAAGVLVGALAMAARRRPAAAAGGPAAAVFPGQPLERQSAGAVR